MLQRAIGDQLTCVFVDNGPLRLNEGDQVMATFAENMGIRVIRADAEEKFLGKLPVSRILKPSARSLAIPS